jgi:ribonuclease HI
LFCNPNKRIKPLDNRLLLWYNGCVKLIAHTDGGSRGNPGPAAYAAVIRTTEFQDVIKIKKYIGKATCNVAEYLGVLAAVRYAAENAAESLFIYSDSQLVVQQVRGFYTVKDKTLKALYDKIIKLLPKLQAFHIEHVKREKNKEADALVNEALDEEMAR